LCHETNIFNRRLAQSISENKWEEGMKTKSKSDWNEQHKKCQSTYLISISLDLMSPIELPMNDICSSLTPDRLTLIHLNIGTEDRSVCRNCGSTRCFLPRSSTDMPSILMWLIGDDFMDLEIALKVFVASSRCIIQLQIFNVFRSLEKERTTFKLMLNSGDVYPSI
jgi:hypothetical protein